MFIQINSDLSSWLIGGAISVAVSVLAILWAVKNKYNTARWRGAGRRVFWFSLLFIIPAVAIELLGQLLLDSLPISSRTLIALINLLYFIVFVGGAEEAGKYFAIYTGTGGYHRMTSKTDILNYALISAAAFTGLENILYFIRLEGDTGTAVVRALLSSPFHITCTMLIAIGRLRTMQTGQKKFFISGLSIAILIHGFFDFVSISETMTHDAEAISGSFVLFMVVAMIFVVLNLLKAPRRLALAHSQSTCKQCGFVSHGLLQQCPQCGGKAFLQVTEFEKMTFPQKTAAIPVMQPVTPVMQPFTPTAQPTDAPAFDQTVQPQMPASMPSYAQTEESFDKTDNLPQ